MGAVDSTPTAARWTHLEDDDGKRHVRRSLGGQKEVSRHVGTKGERVAAHAVLAASPKAAGKRVAHHQLRSKVPRGALIAGLAVMGASGEAVDAARLEARGATKQPEHAFSERCRRWWRWRRWCHALAPCTPVECV